MSGVVLWVDYVRKRVEITLQPKIMSKINEVQGNYLIAGIFQSRLIFTFR